MKGRREIMTWLDSWGVPRGWPAARPASFPACYATERSRRLWARGGHFGASQVPGLAMAGPGAIDPERLTGWPAPAAVPATAPDIGELLGTRAALPASLAPVR
jgi:hypothetical protein